MIDLLLTNQQLRYQQICMTNDRRKNSPGFYLSTLMRLHRQDLANEVRSFGLNFCQLSLILEVVSCPGKSQDEISLSLGIDKAATARNLAALERADFIERRENIENRRQKLVYSTDKAKKIEKRLRTVLDKSKEYFFKGFTSEEKDKAIEMLMRMVDSYKESLEVKKNAK